MKKLITILAALAVSVSFATAADAEKKAEKNAGKGNPEEMFKKLDTNNDGFLSLEEFKVGKKDPAKAEAAFKKHDLNGDGKISLEEFKTHHGHEAAPAAGPAPVTTEGAAAGEKSGVTEKPAGK